MHMQQLGHRLDRQPRQLARPGEVPRVDPSRAASAASWPHPPDPGPPIQPEHLPPPGLPSGFFLSFFSFPERLESPVNRPMRPLLIKRDKPRSALAGGRGRDGPAAARLHFRPLTHRPKPRDHRSFDFPDRLPPRFGPEPPRPRAPMRIMDIMLNIEFAKHPNRCVKWPPMGLQVRRFDRGELRRFETR